MLRGNRRCIRAPRDDFAHAQTAQLTMNRSVIVRLLERQNDRGTPFGYTPEGGFLGCGTNQVVAEKLKNRLKKPRSAE